MLTKQKKMSQTSNEQHFDSLVRHQTYLMRFARGLSNRMMGIIRDSNERMEDIARSRLAGITSAETPAEWARVRKVMEQMIRIRSQAWAEAKELARKELRDLARAEPRFIKGRMESVLPVVVDVKLPSASDVDRLLARPIQGRSQGQHLDQLRVSDLSSLRANVTGATTEGFPLLGSIRSGFARTANSVQTVTRTLTTATSSAARTAVYEANDEIQQEEFIAVLDSRTTLICASNDGKIFVKSRGPKPPLHFGCRSIRVGVLAQDMLKDYPLKPQTERELVTEYARENNLGTIARRDDLPYGWKGSFDRWAPQRVAGLIGPPAERVSYNDWLRRQSDSFVVDTLGATRAALFKKGNLNLSRFVDSTGSALNLEELERRMPDLFNNL